MKEDNKRLKQENIELASQDSPYSLDGESRADYSQRNQD
ncbi:hypothetical protein M595_2342 [Lyngbya aestuarii BL J]|uniref:Uncharacterized protein n=1 Tax=Lyngbya aestuarii BL J TaxID=1348334 RepID=U7QKJ0_9CYAN|nr:hypothetical protein M595_2342 [Lyngbya aestuarii BL J]